VRHFLQRFHRDAPAEPVELREAESLAVDLHKWLCAPPEAVCALVRNREKLRDALAYL
jgi:glutamate/tyrosine decarboxylase-like PLP-dependent enzyme